MVDSVNPYTVGQDKELDELLDGITPLEELSPFVKATLHGPMGSGKTTLGATAGKKILYIDNGEGGWASLLDWPERLANIAHRMQFISLKQLDILAERIAGGSFPLDIDCIMLDTVSDMQKKDLDQIMAYRCKQDPSKDPWAPTQPDYNANTNRMRRTLSKFRDLDMNVVFISQSREDEDKESGLRIARPDVPDKVGKMLGQMAHLVGYCEADGEGADRKFTLQCHPTRRVIAKTRIKALPVKMVNPNLEEIFAMWNPSNNTTREAI